MRGWFLFLPTYRTWKPGPIQGAARYPVPLRSPQMGEPAVLYSKGSWGWSPPTGCCLTSVFRSTEGRMTTRASPVPPERPPGPLSSAPPFCNTLLVPFLFFSLEILSQISSPLHLPCVVFFFYSLFLFFFLAFFFLFFFPPSPPQIPECFCGEFIKLRVATKEPKCVFLKAWTIGEPSRK